MSSPALCAAPHDDDRTAGEGIQVCAWHEKRLRHAISSCPTLVNHLRAQLEPGVKPVDPDQKHNNTEKTPPAPIDVEALSAADDLHAALASWVLLVIEERHVRGPSWAGSDIRPASKRRTPSGVIYDDARVVGVKDQTATLELVRWVFPHVDWMLTREWAAAACTELPEQVATLKARWPMEQRPVYLPVPCPECEHLSLRREPPSYAGAPVVITCQMIECGHIIAEDGFAWAARVIESGGAA